MSSYTRQCTKSTYESTIITETTSRYSATMLRKSSCRSSPHVCGLVNIMKRLKGHRTPTCPLCFGLNHRDMTNGRCRQLTTSPVPSMGINAKRDGSTSSCYYSFGWTTMQQVTLEEASSDRCRHWPNW